MVLKNGFPVAVTLQKCILPYTKTPTGQANVFTYNDYYPYGSIARSGGTTYRYEYQGAYAEKDPITGFNNFDLRMYDGRIGRWLSTDPNAQYYSPYKGMGNNPGNGSDPDGGFWQELGNWLSGNHWISNAGRDFIQNNPGATYNGWQGDKLTGFASVGYKIEGASAVTLFRSVQDFAPHLSFYKYENEWIVGTDFFDKHSSFTPGPFIIASRESDYYKRINFRAESDHFHHEIGHIEQYKKLGIVSYTAFVAIPSALEYNIRKDPILHNNFYTEKWANMEAIHRFGPFKNPQEYPAYNQKR